jgi:hypothetical protein
MIGMKNTVSLFLLIVLSTTCFAQEIDFSWWNNKANWDGISRWQNYLTISPAFMGPNALPVPQVKQGTMPESSFKLAYDVHTGAENTQNVFTELHVPLFSERVGLNFQLVPFEYYSMDTIIRDLRLARERDGEGTSVGDLYIGTYIQLIKDHRYLPDVLLTINLRTASGNNLGATRYTDSPGYFFDMSFGKNIKFGNEAFIKSIRPYAMGGLYVYQTNRTDYPQNDCFLYGFGTDVSFNKLVLIQSFSGYSGYINNGDSPFIYRAGLRTKFKRKVNYEFRFQKGINDFPYISYRIGCIFKLDSFTKPWLSKG